MPRKVIEASTAVAEAVKFCKPAVIPMYPITPQTHIVERISEFINDGDLDSEMIHVESEHSALSAAIGSSATGVRTYTATASQGLALMHEVLFVASGMRLPIVMNVANRALSAPINIWNDHSDSMAARDSSWIQLYVESAQEAFDTTIQAFKIAENKKVLLPIMVCLDGFTLSHVYEPVDLPQQSKVNGYLPKYKPSNILDVKKPVSLGPIGYPDSFMHFKKAQQDAMDNALKIIKKSNSEFKTRFKRSYGNGLIETYNLKGAKFAIVCAGSICGTTRVAVDELRKQGIKVGLIKIKCFRPFPKEDIIAACKKLTGVAVIDRAVSFGFEGPMFTDLKAAIFNEKKKPLIHSFIAGLGGRDVTKNDMLTIFKKISKTKKPITEWLLD
ncbi:pyruvate ferredoxin oxidoreductase [Candidatus Woesearchaeota archaeon]|jgi:pyruvate ferredoxin oxidoreductase alpha subunit|nr:pyruvate ferredoxin oxidoreductase [Candidatus Woesearchaeota archaeon]MBT6519466.1 pyruvate ferredoxin oxidoreductase [Candidatus Woesearchaeota archaeon]MBT7368214.1 pyruvate ferredoxin oxidoreductase [Candidatus Woesearchaeota archaeon]